MESRLLLADQSSSASGKPHPTEAKIRSYVSRTDRWHFGEGVTFNPDVIEAAVTLHDYIVSKGHYRTNAFPGLGGEIIVTVYHGPSYYEFALTPQMHLIFTHEVGDVETVYRKPISMEEAHAIIENIRASACNSLDSSAENTTTPISVDSRVGPLATLAVVAGYLSSIASVWKVPAEVSAYMSDDTILTLPQSVRSSGIFPETTFPVVAS